MSIMANNDLRDRIRRSGYYAWQVADAIGIHEVTLSIWLRRELPATDSRRIRIESALRSLEAERTGGKDGEEQKPVHGS